MTSSIPTRPGKGADRASIDTFVASMLKELSLEEKVWMMSGHGFLDAYVADDCVYNARPYVTGGGNKRLGLPELRFTDGPRGVAVGRSTCFPVAMARGASWDVALEEKIGQAMGREARAQEVNFFGGVCINLLRHPAWGRAQETYGEDPFHLGEMGVALMRGVQHHNVIATVKHFAANSIENARFKVDVRMSERVLREVYLPHFKRAVDAGVGSVMSAYNKVLGHWCGHQEFLLTRILKEEWGFEGFVHSDFIKGVHSPEAAAAGLDVENPEPIHFGDSLVRAVEEGRVPTGRIDDAVRRILTTLLVFSCRPDPEAYPMSVVASLDHRKLAREVAEKSSVLLANANEILPLDPASGLTIALIGALAGAENLGDQGSSRVRPPDVTTFHEGLRRHAAGGDNVDYVANEPVSSAAARAAAADVAIVVVGLTHRDEGEFIPGDMSLSGEQNAPAAGGDRVSLALPSADEELLLAVAAANPRTVAVVVCGSAITMECWKEHVAAILVMWYPGMEGGTALARLLFGEAAPAGRLPFSIPTDESHLPFFDRDADSIEYDLWHGYSLLEKSGVAPAYPFGFGLTYTRFVYGPTTATFECGRIRCRANVTNVGARAGETVAQLYVGAEAPMVERPTKLLRGFQKLMLEPGETTAIEFELDDESLARWDEWTHCWRVDSGRYRAWVADCSRVETDAGASFVVPSSQ